MAARLSVDDVVLARLIASDSALPYGWQVMFARARGVTQSAINGAIGGRSYHSILSPKPVPSFVDGHRRCSAGHTTTRWRCPSCGRTKARGDGCANRGHSIDHRAGRVMPRRS